MATSSIVDKIRVNNPTVIEDYVAAMEASANSSVVQKDKRTAETISDPTELKEIMLRGIEKWGKK